jgi:formylglycine-generating enzyme
MNTYKNIARRSETMERLARLLLAALAAWSSTIGTCSGQATDESRLWTNGSGASITAVFGGIEKEVVTLHPAGKPRAWVSLNLLTPESRKLALYLDRCGVLGNRVLMKWVVVGDPGNPPSNVSRLDADGAVPYLFQIGMHEVTNAQYCTFLNSVDPGGVNPHEVYVKLMATDPQGGIDFNGTAAQGRKYSLKPNMGDKPVNRINYERAVRFANWLHNDQDGTQIDTGAYDLTKGFANRPVFHSPSAKVWIPTMNEWLKAAYYSPKLNKRKGGYYLFATQSDNLPVKALATPTGEIANPGPHVANYDNGAVWNGAANLTSVGTAGTASYYGTFDQTGNANEWMEPDNDNRHVFFSGGYASTLPRPGTLMGILPVTYQHVDFGFRVAAPALKGAKRSSKGKP